MVKIVPFRSLHPTEEEETLVSHDNPNRFGSKEYDRSVFEKDFCRRSHDCPCMMCSKTPVVVLSPGKTICKEFDISLRNVRECVDGGVLQQLEERSFLIYGQESGGHIQVAVLAALNVEDCVNGIIKKHENIIKDAEVPTAAGSPTKRQRKYKPTNVDPVMMMYKDNLIVNEIVSKIVNENSPITTVRSDANGGESKVWVVRQQSDVLALSIAFEQVENLYISDGHHRTSAAVQYIEQQTRSKRRIAQHSRYLMAFLFPQSQMRVISYNRCVNSIAPHSERSFMAEITQRFYVRECCPFSGLSTIISPTGPHSSLTSSCSASADEYSDTGSNATASLYNYAVSQAQSLSLTQSPTDSDSIAATTTTSGSTSTATATACCGGASSAAASVDDDTYSDDGSTCSSSTGRGSMYDHDDASPSSAREFPTTSSTAPVIIQAPVPAPALSVLAPCAMVDDMGLGMGMGMMSLEMPQSPPKLIGKSFSALKEAACSPVFLGGEGPLSCVSVSRPPRPYSCSAPVSIPRNRSMSACSIASSVDTPCSSAPTPTFVPSIWETSTHLSSITTRISRADSACIDPECAMEIMTGRSDDMLIENFVNDQVIDQEHMLMYMGGRWYELCRHNSSSSSSSSSSSFASSSSSSATTQKKQQVDDLGVQILTSSLLRPVLNMTSPSTDKRMMYVSGGDGIETLISLVDNGVAVAAFCVHRISVEDVIRIADAGELLPPKATCFDPKPLAGLLVRLH